MLLLAMMLLAGQSRGQAPERESEMIADIGALISEVEAVESRLRTIELEASCHVDRGPESNAELPGDLLLEVWRENLPLGRARMVAQPEVWPSASGKLIESWSTHTFDGTFGYSLNDQRDPVPSGQVIEGRPPALMAWSNFTGWVGTIWGNFEEQGVRLSEVFRAIGPDLRLERTSTGVVAMAGSASTARRWFFELHPGLVLSRYEQQQGAVLIREISASGFIEAAPGIFYPSEILDTLRDDEGERRARRIIHCTRVLANSKAFDPSVFVLDFPAGTSVLDRVNDRQIRVGPNADELTAMIAERIEQARREAPAGVSSPSLGSWPWWTAALFVIGASSWLLLRGRGRQRRSAGGNAATGLLATLIACWASGALAAQGSTGNSTWPTPGLLQMRAQNCGLGAALLVLTEFGVPTDPDELAQQLGCGAHWIERTDLHSMGQTFRDHGLLVRGFRNATPEWLRSALHDEEHQIAVVHSTAESGHFLLAYRGDSHRVYFIDPYSNQGWVETRSTDQNRHFWGAMTGMGLLIRPRPRHWDLDTGETIHVDLGTVPPHADLPSFANIPVVHHGTAPLRLDDSPVTGCSCVKSVRVLTDSGRLAPGQPGSIRIAVATTGWKPGRVERTAIVGVRCGDRTTRVKLYICARIADG